MLVRFCARYALLMSAARFPGRRPLSRVEGSSTRTRKAAGGIANTEIPPGPPWGAAAFGAALVRVLLSRVYLPFYCQISSERT